MYNNINYISSKQIQGGVKMKIAREDEVEIVKELQNRMGTKELTAIDFMDQIFIAFHVCDINIKVAQMNMSTRESKDSYANSN